MSTRPILLSWSGGKDAAWTLHRLLARDDVDVVGLLTTVTEGFERIAMHGIRRDILLAQAAATGLPLVDRAIPQQCDNAHYEAAFAAALAQARERWPGLETIAFGDLFLADVRAWREALCTRLGWRIETPLFGADTALLAREMIAGGLRATLCCVDTTQLDAAFSGREFDAGLLEDLPAASTRAANAANSTPASTPGRCSGTRSPYVWANGCCGPALRLRRPGAGVAHGGWLTAAARSGRRSSGSPARSRCGGAGAVETHRRGLALGVYLAAALARPFGQLRLQVAFFSRVPFPRSPVCSQRCAASRCSGFPPRCR